MSPTSVIFQLFFLLSFWCYFFWGSRLYVSNPLFLYVKKTCSYFVLGMNSFQWLSEPRGVQLLVLGVFTLKWKTNKSQKYKYTKKYRCLSHNHCYNMWLSVCLSSVTGWPDTLSWQHHHHRSPSVWVCVCWYRDSLPPEGGGSDFVDLCWPLLGSWWGWAKRFLTFLSATPDPARNHGPGCACTSATGLYFCPSVMCVMQVISLLHVSVLTANRQFYVCNCTELMLWQKVTELFKEFFELQQHLNLTLIIQKKHAKMCQCCWRYFTSK